MNKNTIINSEYKTKKYIYESFLDNYSESILEILEMNYLSDINFFGDESSSEIIRNKLLKSINIKKLHKIIPEYVEIYRGSLNLIPMTNKIQKEIWKRIKNES